MGPLLKVETNYSAGASAAWQHSGFAWQHSAPSLQHSAPSLQHSGFAWQHSAFSAQHSVAGSSAGAAHLLLQHLQEAAHAITAMIAANMNTFFIMLNY